MGAAAAPAGGKVDDLAVAAWAVKQEVVAAASARQREPLEEHEAAGATGEEVTAKGSSAASQAEVARGRGGQEAREATVVG